MNELSRTELATAIRRIGWAYVILHFDFNLGTLNVLPNWWGYLLIVNALTALSAWSPSAKLLRPLGYFLAAANGFEWLSAILGLSLSSGGLMGNAFVFVSLLTTLINLYFHFQLLTDIANASGLSGHGEKNEFLRTRTWYTVLNTVLHLILFFFSGIFQWIGIVLMLINLFIAIVICRQILRFGKWLQGPFDEITTDEP